MTLLVCYKKHMPLLYTDPTLTTIFRQGCIDSVFKRNQSLKELLAPSLYQKKKLIRTNSVTSWNKWDVCKIYLMCSIYFTYSVTNRGYYARRVLHCNCNNVIYLIICKNCLEQCVGSATNFKNRFRIHQSDIKIKKFRCRTAKHFNDMFKKIAMFFSFCLFKLLNKLIVMSQTMNTFYSTWKNIGKPNYLLRLMTWTVWLL